MTSDSDFFYLCRKLRERGATPEGKVNLGALGGYLRRADPAFSPKTLDTFAVTMPLASVKVPSSDTSVTGDDPAAAFAAAAGASDSAQAATATRARKKCRPRKPDMIGGSTDTPARFWYRAVVQYRSQLQG